MREFCRLCRERGVPVVVDAASEYDLKGFLAFGSQGPIGAARAVKALTLPLRGPRPIDEAISTAGGVDLDELTPDLMLKRLPGVFVAGEMLDWEAPTGGYLLQAGFASGVVAADGVLSWVGTADRASRTAATSSSAASPPPQPGRGGGA